MCDEFSAVVAARKRGRGWQIEALTTPTMDSHQAIIRRWGLDRSMPTWEAIAFIEWGKEGNALDFFPHGTSMIGVYFDNDHNMDAAIKIGLMKARSGDVEKDYDQLSKLVTDYMERRWHERSDFLRYLAYQQLQRGWFPRPRGESDQLDNMASQDAIDQLRQEVKQWVEAEEVYLKQKQEMIGWRNPHLDQQAHDRLWWMIGKLVDVSILPYSRFAYLANQIPELARDLADYSSHGRKNLISYSERQTIMRASSQFARKARQLKVFA